MKTKRIVIAFFVMMVLLTQWSFAQNNSPKTQKDKGIATVEIKTSSECEMCKERIEGALAYEKGVKSSDLNLETKVVTVKYRTDKTTVDKLRAVIASVGYDADNVPANAVAYEKLPPCCKKGGHDHDHNHNHK